MPYGLLAAVGTANMVTTPSGVIFPILFASCAVNYMLPSAPGAIEIGEEPGGSVNSVNVGAACAAETHARLPRAATAVSVRMRERFTVTSSEIGGKVRGNGRRLSAVPIETSGAFRWGYRSVRGGTNTLSVLSGRWNTMRSTLPVGRGLANRRTTRVVGSTGLVPLRTAAPQ